MIFFFSRLSSLRASLIVVVSLNRFWPVPDQVPDACAHCGTWELELFTKVDVRHTEAWIHRTAPSPAMAHPPRRVPVPTIQDYAAVPQSPHSKVNRRTSGPPRSGSHMHSGRGAITRGVATGTIGAAYGPYSVRAYPHIAVVCPLSHPSTSIRQRERKAFIRRPASVQTIPKH